MNYVSFSLWGNKEIYNIGVIKNAKLMRSVYPNWEMIVYYDNTVPKETLQELEKLDVVLENSSEYNLYGMFWRFFAAEKDDCEYAIFRDADSRISEREKLAVQEWINSGKSLHVMRDHPYHRIPAGNNQLGILGGMWGIKKGTLPLGEMIHKFPFSKDHKYGNDQTFLRWVYNSLGDDKFTHDDFFEKKPFPTKRENGRFIGERIDVNDKPLTNDHQILL